MNPTYYIWIFLFIILWIYHEREKIVIKKVISSKNRKEKKEMVELAKRFIDKECIIYTYNSQINGVVKEVSEGAVLVESTGSLEAVNLDFVVRLREYPRKKNGKKKSVVID